jgi:L-ascorbate metabolism protein UlaG (beta-lactamase superfamily)
MSRKFLPLRHRDDPSIQRDLNWATHDLDLPEGLEIQWLGTAGFRITHSDTTLLIDPYVSRAPMRAIVGRRQLRSNPDLVERHIPKASAILVGHTHFDHAVDVATIARHHGCPVYGSTSAATLMGLNGLADQAIVVESHRPIEIGPFTVRFTPSRHARLVLGLKVPYDGELTCDSLDGLGAGGYRCGDVWGIAIEVGGCTLYHQGSADLVDDEVRDRDVDVLLCGIAGRGSTRDFVPRMLEALSPGVILAHHHDDFFRAVDDPMGFSFNVNLGGFADDVAREAPRTPVRTLDPLQTITG